MYLLQIWHLTFYKCKNYMGAHIEFRIIKYFLLQQLFLSFLIHIFLQEMKRRISLFRFDRTAHPLLFLKYRVQVLIIGIVATALHVRV
jgi:hypothetical protein